jgi:hypothetical protein
MMAGGDHLNSTVEDPVASAYAFNQNLTEGLGANEDSTDVHYLVVDSGSNMIFIRKLGTFCVLYTATYNFCNTQQDTPTHRF